MTNTQILVVVLILLVLYLIYQQKQANLLNFHSNSENRFQLTKLEQERNHYQTLYQKRVEKDLAADQSEKIKQLTLNIQDLKNNLAGEKTENNLFQQKVSDLENSLFSLAKSKLKGKVEYLKLVEQLEQNYKDKEQWITKKRNNLLNKLDNYLAK